MATEWWVGVLTSIIEGDDYSKLERELATLSRELIQHEDRDELLRQRAQLATTDG